MFLALSHPATPALGTARGTLEMQDGSTTDKPRDLEGGAGGVPNSTDSSEPGPHSVDLVENLEVTVQPWTGKVGTPNHRRHGKRPARAEESPSEKLGKKNCLESAMAQLEQPCVQKPQEAWRRRGRGCCKGQASLAVRTG